MWTSTVRGLIDRSLAMCAFVAPPETSRSTSSSRVVSPAWLDGLAAARLSARADRTAFTGLDDVNRSWSR